MKIVIGPSTGFLFTVVVLAVVGVVTRADQKSDSSTNLKAFVCGITCSSSFSDSQILLVEGNKFSCFCKTKVGGNGIYKSDQKYYEAVNCVDDKKNKCDTTECSPGKQLYKCDLNVGSDETEAEKSRLVTICACGTTAVA